MVEIIKTTTMNLRANDKIQNYPFLTISHQQINRIKCEKSREDAMAVS